MHTGEFTSLGAAIRFYINTLALPERDGIPGAGLYTFNMSNIDESDLREFIAYGAHRPARARRDVSVRPARAAQRTARERRSRRAMNSSQQP